MHQSIFVNQDVLDQLAALCEKYGSAEQALVQAVAALYAREFPDNAPGLVSTLRQGMLRLDTDQPEASSAAPVVRTLAGQQYTKFHYGDFYIVNDQGKTRALEGPFCDNILFPVAERFEQKGGEWRYFFDEQSGFLHGVASIDGAEIPECGTNGWYAMVLYLERTDPAAAADLPHDPHPDHAAR